MALWPRIPHGTSGGLFPGLPWEAELLHTASAPRPAFLTPTEQRSFLTRLKLEASQGGAPGVSWVSLLRAKSCSIHIDHTGTVGGTGGASE